MASIYVLNQLDGKRASETEYTTRKEAKVERNRLRGIGTTSVVSRGPDHPLGPTKPDPLCLNTEKTSRKRYRKKTDRSELMAA